MLRKLDPRFTFDAFVVGPANRLAAAAARKAAEAPGEVYNPLFIHSGSGLGKTHLLGAIAHTVERMHSLPVTYESMPHLLELVSGAVDPAEDEEPEPETPSSPPDDAILEASHRRLREQLGFGRDDDSQEGGNGGQVPAFVLGPEFFSAPEPEPSRRKPKKTPGSMLRSRLRDVSVLLLDDIQFLAGQPKVQEELLQIWDALASRGAQVVLASDRPPPEIDDLDHRLLTRLSGGLIVDIGSPDFDTRVAIARRKARDRGVALAPETFRALAQKEFTNVRELQGALNRILAVQELEEREIRPEEVPRLLGGTTLPSVEEYRELLEGLTGTVGAVTEQAHKRVADALLRWEGEGFRTHRLDEALGTTVSLVQADRTVDRFERDVRRLQAIAESIRELDPEAVELSAEALKDPDRLDEAESLLDEVRLRLEPLPAPPRGPGLDQLPDVQSMALRSARAVVEAPGRAYNPLYVLGPAELARPLLVAIANGLAANDVAVAFVDGAALAEELVRAAERDRIDGWRARYRRGEALVLAGLEQLAGLERGHDELFYLFEELQARSRQLVFCSRVPPKELALPSRLQSRLEAGLVVELNGQPAGAARPGTDRVEDAARATSAGRGAVTGAREDPSADEESPRDVAARRAVAEWIHSPEKVLLEWPYEMDWIQQVTG